MKSTDQNNKAKDESHIEFPWHRDHSLVRQSGGRFMKNMKNILIFGATITLISVGNIFADGGAGTVGGLSFTEPAGARAASLGEAFTAATNDVTALHYNPSSLGSLQSGQASFMYQKGLADDAYGRFIIGSPSKLGNWGLSLGYYNSGAIALQRTDTGPTENVTAQKDLTMGLSYAHQLIGSTSFGITGKYLSSKLVDQYSAATFAGDFGVQSLMGDRLTLGLSVLNLGGKVTYLQEGDSLPLTYRMGMSYLLKPGAYATTLMVDAPYRVHEKEFMPAAGLEVKVLGPLMIRGGYQRTNGLRNEFTMGAGLLTGGGMSFDYSFGMVNQLSAEQRVSVGMSFGGNSFANTPIVKRPVNNTEKLASKPRQVEEVQKTASKPEVTFVQRHSLASLDEKKGSFNSKSHQVYIIRPGDTLGKIAMRFYGDAREWKKIYAANRHLLDDNKSIEVGQKIVLP